MTRVSHVIGRIEATFDDSNLVANTGLLLSATLVDRLGLKDMIDDTVKLAGRVGGAHPGCKVLTLVHSMIAGGSHIDHHLVIARSGTGGPRPFDGVTVDGFELTHMPEGEGP